MTELIPHMLHLIQSNHLPGLNLGNEFICPAYDGYSILNIPASVCRAFNIPLIHGQSLAGPLDAIFDGQEFQRVILVVVDALAFERMQGWMQDGTAPVWQEIAKRGLFAPITSIVPSTTSAAITSLWTGLSATEHGLTGYEMWLKEYGLVINTITHSAISFQNDPGGLYRAGFKAEDYLQFPPISTYLARHNIKTYAMQHASIVNSGLSRTYFKDLTVQRFYDSADLWINLRNLLENNRSKRFFAYVYWSEIDTLSHAYGPDDERTTAEFSHFSAAFERLFYKRLKRPLFEDTLLILTADHGAIGTQPDAHYDLRRHPQLTQHLHLQPTGENRLVYLYIKPGHVEAVAEYIERTWPNQFSILQSTTAVQAGLYGPGELHPGLMDRIGDWVVVARGNAYLWWANKENLIYGRHGGLHPLEMLVPFLAVRL